MQKQPHQTIEEKDEYSIKKTSYHISKNVVHQKN